MFETIDNAHIQELVQTVGPTLVAFVANNKDQKVSEKWLAGTVHPTSDEIRRLTFLHECIERVTTSEKSTDMARTWLIGRSVTEGLSPAEAIRSDNFDGVEVSLHRLINDTWS